MSARIVRIEAAGPDRRARRLVFDDDLEPRITSAAAAKALGLEAGAETDRATTEQALAEVELPLAKDRAISLLGYRERSAAEVARKLRENGYPEAVVSGVVDRFTDLELIDDARFALAWARTRTAAGYGRRRISRELAEKGIDPDVAAAALDEASDPSDELNRAIAALRGKVAADRSGRDRLVRRLVSRGFELGIAIKAVDFAQDEAPFDE